MCTFGWARALVVSSLLGMAACGGKAESDPSPDRDSDSAIPSHVYPLPPGILCFHTQPPLCEDGTVLLRVFEVAPPETSLTCDAPGRTTLGNPGWRDLVLGEEREVGRCDAVGQGACEAMVLCEILPVPAEPRSGCLDSVEPAEGENGFCVFSTLTDIDGDGVHECNESGLRDDCVGSLDVMGEFGCGRPGGMVRTVGDVPKVGSQLYSGMLLYGEDCRNDY